MKILITGASGFIGSHLVEEGLRQGMEVWAAVRGTSNRKWLSDPRIQFIELNLENPQILSKQIEEHVYHHGAWDYVIHAAGATKCKNPEDFFRINRDGTENLARVLLLRYVNSEGVPEKALRHKLVFISSLSIMGALHENDYAEICGDEVAQPNTAYGRSKLEAEERLKKFSDLDYIILRPTGVYGPRELDYKIMADSIRKHIDFAAGFKRQVITFVYVDDVVQAAYLALTKGSRGQAYILSDGNDYTSRSFSDLIQKTLGIKYVLHITAPLWFLRFVCKLGINPTLNMDKYHILSQRNWRCNIEPARRDLGFKPQWPLERGVAKCKEWYLS